MKFREFGIEDKLVLFTNGKQVVEYFESILQDPETDSIQPVSLLILDINMPIYNGMKALALIEEMYQRINNA